MVHVSHFLILFTKYCNSGSSPGVGWTTRIEEGQVIIRQIVMTEKYLIRTRYNIVV